MQDGVGGDAIPSPVRCGHVEGWCSSSFLQGHPPSLRFGHPDVTSDDTAPPRTLGYPRWRAVFSGCALRVSHGRSPMRSEERAERPGDGCPCVGAEETCGVPSQPAGRGRTPPLHAYQALLGRVGAPSGSDIRVPSRVLSAAKRGRVEHPRGGFPCRSVGRSAPAASHRNANTASEPVSCRSCPAAHSHEREPNAPRSAQPPASNQRQRQPQRCRCAPPARVRPNRQCR